MTDSYQWRRCDGADPGDGSTCADIPGATGRNYLQTAADVGHRLQLAGARDGVAALSSQLTRIVAAADPAPASDWDTIVAARAPASWSAGRTRLITSYAQLLSFTAEGGDALDGDLLVPTVPINVTDHWSTSIKKRVRLDNTSGLITHLGTSRTGPTFPAIGIYDARGFEYLSPKVTGAANAGILVYDGDIEVWNADVSGTAGTCMSVLPMHRNARIVGSMVCTNTDANLALDPHVEKGSGIHGSYWGGGTSAPYGVGGEFSIDGTDINYGALAEVNHALGLKLWLRGNGLNFAAHIQTGGNGFQPWGDDPIGGKFSCEVAWCEITDAQGRPTDANGAGAGLLSTSHLVYGRASNCNQNPYVAGEGGLGAGVLWDPRGGMIYGDVSPANMALHAAAKHDRDADEARQDAYESSRRAEAKAIAELHELVMRDHHARAAAA